MAYLEANLKRELRDALRQAGCVCELIPDLARATLKPYDMVAGVHGCYVAIETKLVRVGTAANPGRWHDGQIILKRDDVRPNQHKALKEAECCASIGFVIGGIYDRYDHDRQAYAIPYHTFMTRDVWTLADCRRLAIPLCWERRRGWDVDGIVIPIAMSGVEAFR